MFVVNFFRSIYSIIIISDLSMINKVYIYEYNFAILFSSIHKFSNREHPISDAHFQVQVIGKVNTFFE